MTLSSQQDRSGGQGTRQGRPRNLPTMGRPRPAVLSVPSHSITGCIKCRFNQWTKLDTVLGHKLRQVGVNKQCQVNVTDQECEFAGATGNAPGRQTGDAHPHPHTSHLSPTLFPVAARTSHFLFIHGPLGPHQEPELQPVTFSFTMQNWHASDIFLQTLVIET